MVALETVLLVEQWDRKGVSAKLKLLRRLIN